MASLRRLIINADDFGLSAGVNRAIAECYQSGAVTSSTLMANSQAFSGAVAIAKTNPKLSVGCHVVLVDGEPVSPSVQVPSLAEHGKFHDSLLRFASSALRGKISDREIANEATAQIGKLQASGIAVAHIDTHKHTHIFPQVLKPLLEAARECGVKAVRNPFVPAKPLAFAHLFRRPRLWTRYSEVKLLGRYRAQFAEQVARLGMRTPDGSFGIVVTGALDAELFDAIIGSIPEGTWELVCHPGYDDADLSAVRTRLRESRHAELKVLTSERARESIHKNGVELISYSDLATN